MERMKKEDRRIQILESAMKVFVDRGFSGSTTLEIAKAAEISEVTLFRYFNTKQEIFLEGIKPILISTLEGSISTSSDLSPAAKLEYILYERISLISNNYKIIRLILTEAPLLSELGAENFMNRILQILENMLIQIGVTGSNKEFTLRLLMGSILSFLYMPESDSENLKKYVSNIVTQIIKDINK
ncbi:MAG: TetR/AcrR family transcriptional regulator [Firmicutes bacterium]|nr:TetR/AcrR family transcriptional regulator [Bacillota bacterium]